MDDPGTPSQDDTGPSDSEDTSPPEDTGEDCTEPVEWFYDADGDGYGDPDLAAWACTAPAGFVDRTGDCDDLRSDVHPELEDTCNGIDDDCDELVDEDADTSTWYPDADADGYGDPDAPAESCALPEGHTADATDCDDSDELVYPGASEVPCDGTDHDCDGFVWTCTPEGVVYLSAEAIRVEGQTAGAHLAQEAHVADIDLDGLDDLLLSAPEADGGAGVVHAWLGPLTAATDTSTAALTVTGTYADDGLGSAMLGGLDGDGDGYEDLLLGAGEGGSGDPLDPAEWNEQAGMLYWFAGPVTGGSLTADTADFTWEGQSTSRSATLLVPGDFDGDGLDDVAIAAPNIISSAHKLSGVWLLTAPFDTSDERLVWISTLTLAPDDNSGGARGLGAGDVDGDGVDDLVVSDEHEVGGAAGTVDVLLGPITATSTWTDSGLAVDGVTSGQLLGAAVDVGDLDGDGYADLLLGAPGDDTSATDGGAVYLVTGGTGSLSSLASAAARFTCDLDEAALGSTLEITDDLDGDGLPELLLGGPGEDDGAGAAWLVASPHAGTLDVEDDAHARFETSDYDAVGSSLAWSADLTGDDVADLLLGAPTDQTSSEAGAAWILPLDSGL